MNVKYYSCPNCGTSYLNKPPQCVLSGIVLWPSGCVSGCGEEKYPIIETVVNDVVSASETWCTYSGLLVVLTTTESKEHTVVFCGQGATERRQEFSACLSQQGVRVDPES